MDEQNKNQQQELQTPATEKAQPPQDTTRQILLRTVCGGYLIYLAYNLISSLFTDYEVLTWTTIQIVSVVGSVVFAVVGVLLLINVAKTLWNQYGPKQ